MNNFGKHITQILLLGIIIYSGYFFRDDWKAALFPVVPCAKPITYSLAAFDSRFGISQEEFLDIVEEAEKGWEDAAGKQLFSYDEEGPLEINLLYDYRQQATDRLSDVGVAINEDKSTYNKVKAEYDALLSRFNREKDAYEREAASYDASKDAYDEKVEYWNSQGGAPAAEYQTLKREQERLDAAARTLNRKAAELNSLSRDINGTAAILNDLVKKLNIKVATFNTIGASTGEEFNEGEYIRDKEGTRINIYQYEDKMKLHRLLQHELGHALGLDHVEDDEAIMYRLNSSSNAELTDSDVAELKRVCTQTPKE